MKLEEIEKLCDEATPAPWTKDSYDYKDGTGERIRSLGPITYWAEYASDSSLDIDESDIKFIVASRELMPDLVSRVRELEAELEMVSKERDTLLKVAKAAKQMQDNKYGTGVSIEMATALLALERE